jgi:hypothetical protein
MDLEVLVATMGQEDCSLAEKMNIQTAAVIANQCDRWGYDVSADGKIRMISTETRGVGINRNLALQLAKGDILLFADDDLVYYDGALNGVVEAFREFPDADVIFFGASQMFRVVALSDQEVQEARTYKWHGAT